MCVHQLRSVLLVACGLVCAGLTACDKTAEAPAEPPRLVSAIKLGGEEVLLEGDFPGRAAASQELNLSFRVTGQLAELPAKVGDSVKGGQVLAQLDRRDFQVQIDVAQGHLAKANADTEVAQSNYDRGVSIQKKTPAPITQAILDQRLGGIRSRRESQRPLRPGIPGRRPPKTP